MIPEEGSNQCVECSLEALLQCRTHLNEIVGRPPDESRWRLQRVIEDLLHCERDHLKMKFPELAEKVRKLRKSISACQFSENETWKCFDISEVTEQVNGLIDEVTELVPHAEAGDIRKELEMKHKLVPARSHSSEAFKEKATAIVGALSDFFKVPTPKVEVTSDCEIKEGSKCDGAYNSDVNTIFIQKDAEESTVPHEFGHYHGFVTKHLVPGTPESEDYARRFEDSIELSSGNQSLSMVHSGYLFKRQNRMVSKDVKDSVAIVLPEIAAKWVEKGVRATDTMFDASAASKPLFQRASPYVELVAGVALVVAGMYYAKDPVDLALAAFGGHMIAESSDAVDSFVTGTVHGVGRNYKIVNPATRGLVGQPYGRAGTSYSAAVVNPPPNPGPLRGRVKDYTGRI